MDDFTHLNACPLNISIVCISDTHGLHDKLSNEELPPADLLIHAGDFTKFGKANDAVSFRRFLEKQAASNMPKYQFIIVVNGNHEVNTVWKKKTKGLLEQGEFVDAMLASEGKPVGDDGVDEDDDEDERDQNGEATLQNATRTNEGMNAECKADEANGKDNVERHAQEDQALVGSCNDESLFKTRIIFLQDEFVELDVKQPDGKAQKVRVYGTQFYWPMSPVVRGNHMSFSLQRLFLNNPFTNLLLGAGRPATIYNKNPYYDQIPRNRKNNEEETNSCEKNTSNRQLSSLIMCKKRRSGDDVGISNSTKTDLFPNIDILITHGPCKDVVDGNMGCGYLGSIVEKEIRPRAVISGHIHHAHGVEARDGIIYVNASICGSSGYGKGWKSVVLKI